MTGVFIAVLPLFIKPIDNWHGYILLSFYFVKHSKYKIKLAHQ